MENFEDIKTIAIFVGILLQVIGLLAVVYQLKKVNITIRVTAQAALYQQSSHIRSLLVKHPELRKYFFDGKVISPDSEHYDRARTIAEMILNYLEHTVIQKESLRKGDFNAWHKFVYRTISDSPIIQSILNERPELYTGDLLEIYKAGKK